MNRVHIEYVPLSTIAAWPRNPKQHAESEIDGSIRRFGYVAPMTLDEGTGRLVAGHGRMESLLRLQAEDPSNPPDRIRVAADGEWLAPVLRGVTFESEGEAEAYLLADNRLVEAGGWDQSMLTKILFDLRHQNVGTEGMGWSTKEISALLKAANADGDEDGETIDRGKTPEEEWDSFVDGDQKQIVFYFLGEEYDTVIERVAAVQSELDGDDRTNTAVFLHLLNAYEARRA